MPFRIRQNYPRSLRVNCLLTRYPLCFIHGVKNLINSYDYWHGIIDFLKAHGYQVYEIKTQWRGKQNKRISTIKKQIDVILKDNPKIHIFGHSLGTLDSLLLKQHYKEKIESMTLLSPPFGGTPWADWGKSIFSWLNDALTPQSAAALLEQFKKDETHVTAIISNPQFKISPILKVQHHTLTKYLLHQKRDPSNDGLIPLESQMVASQISDKIVMFPGDHIQVIGAGPWPKDQKTAHEVILDHCIFLAERDLQKAK